MRKLLLTLMLLPSIAAANELSDWFTTAAGNDTGAAPNYPIEGMAPSAVNDTMREMMAVLARNYADVNGSGVTAGSANTYTLAAAATVTAYADGDFYVIEINATNTSASTLNVDTLGAKDILTPDGSALAGGELQAGGRYIVSYDGTQFLLLGFFNTIGDININGTTAVDLTDTDNPLNIGDLAGTHLAMSPAIVQAKSDATTATDLDINPLGGNVTLYDGAAARLATTAAGLDGTGTIFSNDSGADSTVRTISQNTIGGLGLEVLTSSGSGVLRQMSAGGSGEDAWVEMTRNGSVTINYDSSARQVTRSDGVDFFAAGGGNTILDVVATSTDDPIVGLRGSTNGGVRFYWDESGTDAWLRQTSTGGTLQDPWIRMNKDSSVDLYHDGNLKLNTSGTGVAVTGALTSTTAGATTSVIGTTEHATAAETLTGTSEVLSLTPGGLAGNSSGLGSNAGSYEFPGGFLIQWGTTASINDDESGTITWDTAWTSSTSYQATCTPIVAPSGGADGWAVTTMGTTTTTVWNDTDQSNTFRCIGVGN